MTVTTVTVTITHCHVTAPSMGQSCDHRLYLRLHILGWLLCCIPTLPFKLWVDLVVATVVCRVCDGRNMMGALKNLQHEGKSYHQKVVKFLLYHHASYLIGPSSVASERFR
jgi:hypothetical protein